MYAKRNRFGGENMLLRVRYEHKECPRPNVKAKKNFKRPELFDIGNSPIALGQGYPIGALSRKLKKLMSISRFKIIDDWHRLV